MLAQETHAQERQEVLTEQADTANMSSPWSSRSTPQPEHDNTINNNRRENDGANNGNGVNNGNGANNGVGAIQNRLHGNEAIYSETNNG